MLRLANRCDNILGGYGRINAILQLGLMRRARWATAVSQTEQKSMFLSRN
jgi:hypothetical protein